MSIISSARARSWSLLSGAMGWGVNITGSSGVPHMAAMDLDVLMKESVHIVTDGTPAFSAWIPSCTLHALQEPQSPTPAMM